MPNWVFNKVRFYGNKERIKELREFVKTNEREFDFQKIIPMPEELNITAGGAEEIAIECANAYKNGKTTTERYESSWAKQYPFMDLVELGNKYLSNLKKYGATTWYDWSWDNWGTKWNAHEPAWAGDDYLTFETAWNAPERVFQKLSELFPDISFDVMFADEDIGNNCGTMDYDGHSFVVNYINEIEFACDVWGYDYEEYTEEYALE